MSYCDRPDLEMKIRVQFLERENAELKAKNHNIYNSCWRLCMSIAKETRNVWVALVAQNCAIAIAHERDDDA